MFTERLPQSLFCNRGCDQQLYMCALIIEGAFTIIMDPVLNDLIQTTILFSLLNDVPVTFALKEFEILECTRHNTSLKIYEEACVFVLNHNGLR